MNESQNNHPLHTLIELEKAAEAYGFEWPDIPMILDYAKSECDEIQEALDKKEPEHRVQEEIGDLIHSAISLCFFAGFDVEDTIGKVNEKFSKRMDALREIGKARGFENLKGLSTEEMLALWEEAKKVAAL